MVSSPLRPPSRNSRPSRPSWLAFVAVPALPAGNKPSDYKPLAMIDSLASSKKEKEKKNERKTLGVNIYRSVGDALAAAMHHNSTEATMPRMPHRSPNTIPASVIGAAVRQKRKSSFAEKGKRRAGSPSPSEVTDEDDSIQVPAPKKQRLDPQSKLSDRSERRRSFRPLPIQALHIFDVDLGVLPPLPSAALLTSLRHLWSQNGLDLRLASAEVQDRFAQFSSLPAGECASILEIARQLPIIPFQEDYSDEEWEPPSIGSSPAQKGKPRTKHRPLTKSPSKRIPSPRYVSETPPPNLEAHDSDRNDKSPRTALRKGKGKDSITSPIPTTLPLTPELEMGRYMQGLGYSALKRKKVVASPRAAKQSSSNTQANTFPT